MSVGIEVEAEKDNVETEAVEKDDNTGIVKGVNVEAVVLCQESWSGPGTFGKTMLASTNPPTFPLTPPPPHPLIDSLSKTINLLSKTVDLQSKTIDLRSKTMDVMRLP